MNTKISFVALLLLLSSFATQRHPDLNYDFADKYCQRIEVQLGKTAQKYNLETSEILPIVYPECARFSVFSNVFESNALEYYYVQDGVKGADFSIGYFQMKPSFVEHVEQAVEQDSSFAKVHNLFAYKTSDLKEIRSQRLDRMMNEQWQMEYLCCFVKLMKKRIAAEKITSNEIKFMAAAYNYGFLKPSTEIIRWQEQAAFPYGLNAPKPNISYAQLAYDFHLKITRHE